MIYEIKSTKVGQGSEFPPRETNDLLEKLKEWLMLRMVWQLLSVLDKPLFCKAITNQEHKDIVGNAMWEIAMQTQCLHLLYQPRIDKHQSTAFGHQCLRLLHLLHLLRQSSINKASAVSS